MYKIQIKIENIIKIIFVVSVFVIGFGYGFISHRENIFPQSLLHEASLAASALLELTTENNRADMPGTFMSFDREVESGPNAYALESSAGFSGEDWILVTGGPYEYLEECPTFGCLAWVIDHDGTVMHSWEVDLDSLWADTSHVSGVASPKDFKPVGIQLLPDGSILATFHVERGHPYGAGLAKFDISGNLIWAKMDNSHHWFTTDAEGRIYTPAHYEVKTPLKLGNTKIDLVCDKVGSLIDFIQVVDSDGNTVEKIPLFDILIENGFTSLIDSTWLPCDPLHLNFVQYIDEELASRLDGAEVGDLLVSMRDIHAVALLNPGRREFKRMISGLSSKQHSPKVLPDGSIIIFDNWGGDRSFGGSRISRYRLGQHRIETVFPLGPLPGDLQFFSGYGGYIDVHPAGDRALVSSTETGEVFEIELGSGEVLWRYEKLFPTKNYPNVKGEDGSFIQVEAFGAYYVDRSEFAAILAAR